MKYGVCTDPEMAPALGDAGFEFIELHTQNHLKTQGDEAAFAPELDRIRASALPCEASNCFVPGSLKITGPNVDMDALAVFAKYFAISACEPYSGCRNAQISHFA